MIQKVSTLLTVALFCTILLSAQTKMTAANLTGTWQIVALKVEGEKVDITSEASLRNFLLKGALKDKQKDSANAVLTAEDSAGISMPVTFLSAFSKLTLIFNANKTFRISVPQLKKTETGTWMLNEKLQKLIMRSVKGKAKGRGIVDDAKDLKWLDGQLLMQMEVNKEEGFLFTKVK